MTTPRAIAEAFSAHRFAETRPHLADDVTWVLVGADVVRGAAAVQAVCADTAAELADAETAFDRFLVVEGEDAVAVDAIGRYTAADGTVSLVSSCDLYEFRDDRVVRITSYTVELDAAPV